MQWQSEILAIKETEAARLWDQSYLMLHIKTSVPKGGKVGCPIMIKSKERTTIILGTLQLSVGHKYS